MNTIDAIKSRRSVRKFRQTAVPNELLEQLVEIASFSPSWKNSQVTRYIAITDSSMKQQLADVCCGEHNASILKPAPLLIATTIITGRSGYERDGSFSTVREDDWQAYDCGAAGLAFCLAAHELGLSTVTMGLYDIDKAAAIIGIPEGQQLMALIALGYPDEIPETPPRKPVDTLLSYR